MNKDQLSQKIKHELWRAFEGRMTQNAKSMRDDGISVSEIDAFIANARRDFDVWVTDMTPEIIWEIRNA